jgi:replicative DNA helicase
MATSPEGYLISSVLRQRDYTIAVAHGINADLFHAFKDEWAWIENYFSKYRRAPSKAAFKRKFPDFSLKAVDDTLHFSDEVRKSHARIMLTASLRDTADAIGEGDIDKAVSKMQGTMVAIAAQIGGINDVDILKDWEGIYSDVKYRKERYEEFGMAGIPTGFDTLDEKTGGVQPGHSWIVGARLGEGKSWTLMRMATTAIMQGFNVHFAALEMTKADVGMRVHNFLSGQIGQTIFQSMSLSQGRDFDLSAYREFLRSLKSEIKGRMTVSDSKRIGEMEIAAQIERHRPDLYFLDYLTLAKTRGDGGWQDIGQLSKAIKGIAGEYGVGIVSAAQLNRNAAESKVMPGPETLGQSDQIGQDADLILTLRKMTDRITKYSLVKNRYGTAGFHWWVHMDMTTGTFKEVSANKAHDTMDEDRDRVADQDES